MSSPIDDTTLRLNGDSASAVGPIIAMPPNQTENVRTLEILERSRNANGIDDFENAERPETVERTETESAEFVPKIIWINVVVISLFHVVGVVLGPFVAFDMKLWTYLWVLFVGMLSGFGVTAGAHRLWSHRAYKATLPLQLILLVLFAMAGMNSLLDWVRDHRVHHKFSETDADPHNSKRGFFFSHVGWLMQKKHPEVTRKGKTLDFTDITDDPLLKFYNKYFLVFKILFCFIVPVVIPVHVWNETWFYAFASQIFFRYMGVLNSTWSVNSFAHIWGQRPYDKRIKPAENLLVSIAALGEGWHNYHHVFPWDYRAAEFGIYRYNLTTMFLNWFAKIGWAYDLRTPSPELVKMVVEKYGDGNYGSKEIPLEEKNVKND